MKMLRSIWIELVKPMNDFELTKRLQLVHGTAMILGRSPTTGIKDPVCSRQQMTLTADYKNSLVSVKGIGSNPSGLNGFTLKKDEEIIVKDGDYVEIILDKYVYVVKFDPPPASTRKEPEIEPAKTNLKRKASDGDVVQNGSLPISSKIKLESEPLKDNHTTKSSDNDIAQNDTFENIDNGLLYILTMKGVCPRSKIAAYDMDGTLIKTKSGNKFPKDTSDWQIAFPEIPAKLKALRDSGFKIVVFTNQATIGTKKMKIEDFKKKVENIFKRLGVSAQIFISTGKKTTYRKPLSGMWNALSEQKNCKVKVSIEDSFYCGDAAGRKGDHSFADRFFAENLKLTFYTPEVHFKGAAKIPYGVPSFDPSSIDRNYQNPDLIKQKKEILVMTGFPGCGKSTLSKRIEIKSKGRYKLFCRDVIGPWQKCVAQAENSIKLGNSVVADSTNLDVESRSRWISLAKKYNIPCRCIYLDISIAHCKHNNVFRELTDKSHTIVNDMIFNTLKSKLVEPNLSEGFTEVVKVKFTPEFQNKEMEKLYFLHLLEK